MIIFFFESLTVTLN